MASRVLLTLMTFVVMPVVTRVLRRWLGPRQTPNRSRVRDHARVARRGFEPSDELDHHWVVAERSLAWLAGDRRLHGGPTAMTGGVLLPLISYQEGPVSCGPSSVDDKRRSQRFPAWTAAGHDEER